MGLLERVGSTITNAGSSVVHKTKEKMETSSINRMIASNEAALRTMYEEVGRIYYEKYKDRPDFELAQRCEVISGAIRNLDELKAGRDGGNAKEPEIEPYYKTPEKPMEDKSRELQKDGPKDVQKDEPLEIHKVCPECGSQIPASNSFCPVCGKRMIK